MGGTVVVVAGHTSCHTTRERTVPVEPWYSLPTEAGRCARNIPYQA